MALERWVKGVRRQTRPRLGILRGTSRVWFGIVYAPDPRTLQPDDTLSLSKNHGR